MSRSICCPGPNARVISTMPQKKAHNRQPNHCSASNETMKTSHKVWLRVVCVLATSLFVGCAGVSLPAARSYSIQIGNTEYHAKTVKFHGQWIEIETETGAVWARNSAVTIKPNK